MSVIYFFLKLIRLLNKNITATFLVKGFLLGFLISFTPNNIVLDIILLLLMVVFSLPIAAVLLGAFIAPLFFLVLDPLFLYVGHLILFDISLLRPLWQYALELPFIVLLGLNNTLMLGSLICSALLSIPLYRLLMFLMKRYAASLKPVMLKINGVLKKADWVFKK